MTGLSLWKFGSCRTCLCCNHEVTQQDPNRWFIKSDLFRETTSGGYSFITVSSPWRNEDRTRAYYGHLGTVSEVQALALRPPKHMLDFHDLLWSILCFCVENASNLVREVCFRRDLCSAQSIKKEAVGTDCVVNRNRCVYGSSLRHPSPWP